MQTGLAVEIVATPDNGAYPLTVSLKANVNGQPAPDDADFEWDLGDGTTSTEANPVHVFTDIGSYEVRLELKTDGKRGVATHDIEVVEVGAGTDIAIEGIEATPATVNPGSPVTVKLTLRNRGTTGYTSSFINRVFISTEEADFDPETADLAGVVNVNGIAGAETVDKSTVVTLTPSFATGEYWIWAQADAGEAIEETDENNNLTRSTTKLTVTSSSLPIDLAVSEPTLGATTFTPGAAVSVETTVSNTGTADAGGFDLKVLLSPDATIDANDTVIHTATLSGLAGGASSPQTLAVTVPANVINRPWYLGVIVDTGALVSETNEQNNAAEYTGGLVTTSGGSGCTEDANEPNDSQDDATALTPGAMTALQVCGATADWFAIDLGPGDRLSSTINFQNVNGNLDLAVFRMGNSTPIATSATSSNSESVNSGIALTAGTYLVRVSLSGAGGGNVYDLTSTLEDNGGAGIDLMPTAISFGSGNGPFPQGMAHNASVTVYNFGQMATTSSFSVSLHLSANGSLDASDTLLGTTSVASLAAGASNVDSRSVTIPTSVPSGYYYLIATADSANTNAETVESNNVFTRQIGVGSGCLDDSFEPNETISTATPMDNGTFSMLQICTGLEANGDIYAITTGAGGTIQVSIAINGTGSGTSDLDMRLVGSNGSSPSDCSSGTNDCSSASTSANESVQYTAPTGGTFYVKVYGYSSTSIAGYSMTVSGSTGSMPDLAPNNVTASPMSVTAGDDVQVDGRIKNNSTQTTPGFEWQVRLSTDSTIDGGDTTLATVTETGLAPNENRVVSKKVTLAESLAGGNYWLGIVADPAGMVTEGSESNNVGVVGPIAVTALCSDDAYEDNDTLGSAAPIAIGGTINGLVICSGDADHFSVTPTASGTLSIHVDFSHALGDIDVRLYQGTTLLKSSISVDDDEDISQAVTAGTVYKIKVYGFNGAANTYSLSTSVSP